MFFIYHIFTCCCSTLLLRIGLAAFCPFDFCEALKIENVQILFYIGFGFGITMVCVSIVATWTISLTQCGNLTYTILRSVHIIRASKRTYHDFGLCKSILTIHCKRASEKVNILMCSNSSQCAVWSFLWVLRWMCERRRKGC